MRTPNSSLDSPDNYKAYKDGQRHQDEKRQTFQAVRRLEDDASSPASDAQLSDHVAELTGNKPAPEDMVRANRELFREAVDSAWAEKLRDRAPITLAMLSDPKDTPLSRDHYDFLASIEQVAENLVRPSRTIQGGAGKEGGGWSSPSIPDVGNETVTDYRKVNSPLPASPDASPEQEGGDADRTGASRPNSTLPASAPMATRPADATAVPPENPGVNPNDAPVGDASQTVPAATPAGTEAGSATAAPAMPGNQGADIANAPGGVSRQTVPDGAPSVAKTEQADATPATQGNSSTNTAGAPEAGLSQTAPSSRSPAAAREGGLAIAGAEGFGLDDGISPDSYMPFGPRSEPILPERTFELPEIPLRIDAPSKRAALSEAIAGVGQNPGYYVVAAFKDLISKQPDLPQDIALDVLNGVANGSINRDNALEKLNYTPSKEREKLADETANAAMLTEEQAKALEERLKKQPYIPVDRALEVFRSVRHMDYGPGPAKNLLMATTDEELANLTERMVLAKGKNPEEIAAVRRGLYEQNAADPVVSDMYFTGFINGYVTEGQLRKIMERHGFVGSVIELVNRTVGSQYKSVGGILKFLDDYMGMPETEEWKKRKALIDDVLHLKGKSEAEFDAVYQRILDNDDPGSLVEAWNAMKEGKDPEEVSKMFPSYPLGDGALAHSKEFVTPGWENSIAGRVGDAAGPLVNASLLEAALRSPLAGALYLALDGGATNHAAAVAADADAKTIRTSDAEATFASFLTNLSPVKWLLGAAPLKKFAGGAIEDMVDGTYGIGMQVVQQTSLNAIAQSYDKKRGLFQDVGPAAASGAMLWGLKIAGRAGFGRLSAAIDAYSLRNNISEAQEAVRRDIILKEFNDIIEQNAPIVSNKRKEIADFIQQKVTNKSNENLYFQVDNFKESLTKAGIDPPTFVESLGGVTLGDFQGATKAGGYVRVPLAAFAAYVMGTKASKALMEHATFKPGTRSPAMSEEFLKSLLTGKSNGAATVPPDGKPAPTNSSPEGKAGQP